MWPRITGRYVSGLFLFRIHTGTCGFVGHPLLRSALSPGSFTHASHTSPLTPISTPIAARVKPVLRASQDALLDFCLQLRLPRPPQRRPARFHPARRGFRARHARAHGQQLRDYLRCHPRNDLGVRIGSRRACFYDVDAYRQKLSDVFQILRSRRGIHWDASRKA